MEHLKSLKTVLTNQVKRNKRAILMVALFFVGIMGYAQNGIDTLANELTQTEASISTISERIIGIIKIIAGIALAISAIGFLYLRSQENDMSKKAGQMVIGVGIFFIIMTLVDLVQG